MVALREKFQNVQGQGALAIKWIALIIPMAVIVGTACAFFLWSLDLAMGVRFDHPWLLYLLPIGGVGVGFLYHLVGRSAEGGNNLIMDHIHEAGGGVPRRMAPLVLFGTLITHLFGGSAGREGTAVQMGGSIASAFCKWLDLEFDAVRIMLMCGIAAGFGAVFGTPIAGAIFAMEVLAIGRVEYGALLPCLFSAIAADWTCHAWGIKHTHYVINFLATDKSPSAFFHLEPWLLAKVVVASAAFGLTSTLFSELSHKLSSLFKRIVPYAPLRPALGAALVIGLFFLAGTPDYLGLGTWSKDPNAITIPSFFTTHEIHYWSWLWKLVFTAVTLSSGFKGGEVTPLFFIGAALGNALAGLLGAPTDLFAALGFIGIFAGATNTPLACTVMGIELFGATHTVYMAFACFLAYLFSGHSGIYLSQRIAVPKNNSVPLPPEISLRKAREYHNSTLIDTDGSFVVPFFPQSQQQEDQDMPHEKHKVTPRELGMIRIYLKPSDKRKQPGLRGFLSARPFYRELVDAAKKDGIMNAVAHHTHYGYSSHGRVQSADPELTNPELTMCVEIIGAKPQLELFCRTHGDILKDKIVIYKHIEHWDIHGADVEAHDATPEELSADEGAE